jgi:hypothetical protein
MREYTIEVTVTVMAPSYEDAKEELAFALEPQFSIEEIISLSPPDEEEY